METYTAPKPFEDYPEFQRDRQLALDMLDIALIDDPLVGLIKDLNQIPYLFTLQCCHGHFQTTDGEEISDFDASGSINKLNKLEYRLAYIVFCIENSSSGKFFAQQLQDIPLTVKHGLVQFCSAQWFWDQWLNSYVLQVMVPRFKDKDTCVIDVHEADKIKQARDIFYAYLKDFASTILEEHHG